MEDCSLGVQQELPVKPERRAAKHGLRKVERRDESTIPIDLQHHRRLSAGRRPCSILRDQAFIHEHS